MAVRSDGWREITPMACRQTSCGLVGWRKKIEIAAVLRMGFNSLGGGLVWIDGGIDEFAVWRPGGMNGMAGQCDVIDDGTVGEYADMIEAVSVRLEGYGVIGGHGRFCVISVTKRKHCRFRILNP